MSRLIKPRWKTKEEFNRLKMRLKLESEQNVTQYLLNCGKMESTSEDLATEFPYIERRDALKIISNRLSLSCGRNSSLQCGFEMSDDEILSIVKKFLDYLETSGKTFKSVNSFTVDFMQKMLEKLRDASSPSSNLDFPEPKMSPELEEFYAELKRDTEYIKVDVFDVVDQFIRYAKHIKIRNWTSSVTIGQMRKILVKVPDEIKYGDINNNNNSPILEVKNEVDDVEVIENEKVKKAGKTCVRIKLQNGNETKKRRNAKKSKDEIADINRKRLMIWKVNFQPNELFAPSKRVEFKARKLEVLPSRCKNAPKLDYYPVTMDSESKLVEKLEQVHKKLPKNIPIIMPKIRPNFCTNFQMEKARFPVFVPSTALNRFKIAGKENSYENLKEKQRNRQLFTLHLQTCQFPISDIALYSENDIERNLQNLPKEYRESLEKKLVGNKF